MVELEHIQTYCQDRRIAIVGNATSILGKMEGKAIDSHDIVVRMNYAVPLNKGLFPSIGRKVSIYVPAMSQEHHAIKKSAESNAMYILMLTRWNEQLDQREIRLKLKIPNIHFGSYQEFQKLCKLFPDCKPSTGAAIVNFFLQNINFREMNLFGIDFFESAAEKKRNIFKSYLYKDHQPSHEHAYFTSILSDNTKIY